MTTDHVDGSQKAAAIRYAADAIRDALHGLADQVEDRQPELLTVKQVAELLHVTPQTVYDMCSDGRIEAKKVGRRVLIPADAVWGLLG